MGGGGSTSTMGSIAPELRGLYTSSANALVGQQKANPLGGYNEAHPMQVEGPNALQRYGASMMMGGDLPTGLDALALQSILRSPGLAGAGPTTGAYDYGAEAGLGDYQSFMQPFFGQGDGLTYARSTPGLQNADPKSAVVGDGGGYNLSDILGPPPQSQFHPLADQGPGGAYGGGQGGGQQISPSVMSRAVTAGGGAPPQMSQASRDRMGGWDKSLSDLDAELGQHGITRQGGGTGGMRLSADGKSYLNLGGSHEGAGPGGQSKFLSDVLGTGSGPGSYGKVAGLDADIAGVAQRMRHAESIGLDPNTSPEELLAFKANQRAQALKPGDAGYANNAASWGAAQQRAAQAGPKLTGADRKKK